MDQELRLKSVSGKELWGKIKRDPKTSRAVVVLAHGLGEHINVTSMSLKLLLRGILS